MRTRHASGMTLIEVMVALAIFSIAMVGLYALIVMGIRVSTDSRARLDATALANERMEMVRNLTYDNVGTVGGVPNGTLQRTELLTVNRIQYTITTDVVYVDDPFDGTLGGTPNDLFNADYKKIRVEVAWPNMLNHNPVVLISDATPKGIENNDSGGTLMLTAFDANGAPVSTPTLHVFNDDVMPPVDLTTTMGDDGRYVLPGMPAAQESYDISVTKPGYSTSTTYPIDAGNPHPTPPPASIFAGAVTELSFSIDRLSTLTIRSLDPGGTPIGSVNYQLRGAKTIRADASAKPIYKYSQAHTTDGAGLTSLTDMEWDTYELTMDSAATGYDIAGTNPPGLINLLPGASQTYDLTLVPHSAHTLLVTVRGLNNALIAGASARLTRVAPPYDVTQTTSAQGQTFFSALSADNYTLTTHADGYTDAVTPVTVDGQSHVEISLAP
jgi:prepilin-type N-terminal cleavage/methylation domain-containing protein